MIRSVFYGYGFITLHVDSICAKIIKMMESKCEKCKLVIFKTIKNILS